MANTTEELYRIFLESAGEQASSAAATQTLLSEILGEYREIKSAQPATTGPSTSAASRSSQSNTESGGSVVGSIASTILKSGFGVAPLVTGLVHLFGSGSSADTPAPLVKYALPQSVQFEVAQSKSQLAGVDYDQLGLARPVSYARSESGGKTEQASAPPQITVNVQAMDARSFMDRSNDIALAVRDAMLNLNAINDVVNDL